LSLQRKPRLPPGWAFVLVSAALGLASAALGHSNVVLLEWHPSAALTQPWRWWTAAFVHYSLLHLLANLAGVALTAALGFVARVPTRVAMAWLVAMPLTHLGLLLQPSLARYGGLSGVLHAGVALVAFQILVDGSRVQRWIGAAILIGLASKIMIEAPWTGPLQYRSGWDIAVAPLAHATGFAAGVSVGALLWATTQVRIRFTREVVE
jgi:rhomboid family GlyGly-CTERM serine protease